MVSIGLSQIQAADQFRELSDLHKQDFDASLVSFSCINSPTNVTVSGPAQELDLLVSHLHKQGVFAPQLKLNVAYHSPHMQSIASEYLKALGQLEMGSKCMNVRMMSSVICEVVLAEDVCTGRYWVKNLVSPVNFFEAMRLCCFRLSVDRIVKKLDRSHYDEIVSHFWVEIGPMLLSRDQYETSLSQYKGRTMFSTYCSAFVRNKSATAIVLITAGYLWCRNFTIDMEKIAKLTQTSSLHPRGLSHLPQYPFDHSILH